MSKKKLIMMSDDIRLHSGVGTMARSIVEGTCHIYDWVNIGGAVKHPDEGKQVDVSDAIKEKTGVKDANVKVYPTSGYGNADLLRQVIQNENPDGLVHFTDPRFWGFLYNMEHEIRQKLMYYNIWDDLPFPHWNEQFYDCCDLLMAISKQTYNINKHVCQTYPRVEGENLTYVPHGIDPQDYRPLSPEERTSEDFLKFKDQVTQGNEYEFIALFNSRNIRRKGTSDLLHAWANFNDKHKCHGKVALILHTDIVDDAGTDLAAVKKALADDTHVIFSTSKMSTEYLNYLYNLSDVVCNPSSAEGFGLSHMEALMSGTPTIATVLGGLQDQMGFKVNGEWLDVKHFCDEKPTNSTGLLSKEHGEWTYPLWPNHSMQGSPQTPYIYDSRPNIKDIASALEYWYNMTSEERQKLGMKGRVWATTQGFTKAHMCEMFIKSVDNLFDTWQPRPRVSLFDAKQPYNLKRGVLL